MKNFKFEMEAPIYSVSGDVEQVCPMASKIKENFNCSTFFFTIRIKCKGSKKDIDQGNFEIYGVPFHIRLDSSDDFYLEASKNALLHPSWCDEKPFSTQGQVKLYLSGADYKETVIDAADNAYYSSVRYDEWKKFCKMKKEEAAEKD